MVKFNPAAAQFGIVSLVKVGGDKDNSSKIGNELDKVWDVSLAFTILFGFMFICQTVTHCLLVCRTTKKVLNDENIVLSDSEQPKAAQAAQLLESLAAFATIGAWIRGLVLYAKIDLDLADDAETSLQHLWVFFRISLWGKCANRPGVSRMI